jgi:hypothetical protein
MVNPRAAEDSISPISTTFRAQNDSPDQSNDRQGILSCLAQAMLLREQHIGIHHPKFIGRAFCSMKRRSWRGGGTRYSPGGSIGL